MLKALAKISIVRCHFQPSHLLFPLRGGGRRGRIGKICKVSRKPRYQGHFGKLSRMSAYNHLWFVTHLQCKTSA